MFVLGAALVLADAGAQEEGNPSEPRPDEEQTAEEEALFAARQVVLAKLAAEMAPRLGEGYLAILPPEVADEGRVVAQIADGWETVLAEELAKVREDLKLTERAALSAILREQKFGDSAYADPQTAVQVGKIAAARTLLLTRLHQFHSDRPTVRVHLEAKLVDVESGEVLWARELRLGVLPPGAKLLLAALGLGLGLPLVFLVGRIWLHGRRRALVAKELPRALAKARDSVEKLERALVKARDRLHSEVASDHAGDRAGNDPAGSQAGAVQEAFDTLQPELLRVRALPGGSADLHRGRDLAAAQTLALKIEDLVATLHRRVESRPETGELVPALGGAAETLRPLVDDYRRLFL